MACCYDQQELGGTMIKLEQEGWRVIVAAENQVG